MILITTDILGVCNPHENLELTYYCIKKEDVEDIGLIPMNGTKKSFENNEKICYGTTISLHGWKESHLDMSECFRRKYIY